MSLLIGDCRIDEVADMNPFDLDLGFLFPDASVEALEPHRSLLETEHVDFEKKLVRLSVKTLILRVAGLTILIDTCVGEHKSLHRADWAGRSGTGFLTRLLNEGVVPEEVDVVMCTHLHADHVGWNTQLKDGRWVPTFPNARYILGRKELEHWDAQRKTKPLPLYQESVLPIVEARLADVVDEGHAIAQGLSLGLLPGHTPGCLGLYVDRAGGRAVFCGDAIHSPLQVVQPEWSTRLCTDPRMAAVTRKKLLEDSYEANRLVVTAHQRGSTAMKIKRAEDGWIPEFV